MKAPIKPTKLSKPNSPNKNQKDHKHTINASHLFVKNVYFDEDGNETDAINADPDWDYERREFTPSLADVLALVPKDIDHKNIFLKLDLRRDYIRNYTCYPFEQFNIIYTTPFDYEAELAKYNQELEDYNRAIEQYEKEFKQYKIDYEKYQDAKKELAILKKREKLEKELAELSR